VGVDGVTFTLFTLTDPLVTPPHTETRVNPYVPHPSDRLNGGFPILLDNPEACPVHVRLICAPVVASAHESVTLLFRLSTAVNIVGVIGATDVETVALYVVNPHRVAPTWKEYVPGDTEGIVNGFVPGTNDDPAVLMVNVQLGVVSAQDTVIDDVLGTTDTIGVAGCTTVIGKTGDDAGPRIPR